MRLRDFAPSPLRPDARTYAYRGLPAFASLSMAGSEGKVIGVLGASVYLDNLVQKIKKITTLPADTVFYALDTQGRIALHTQEGLIFQEAMHLGSPTLAEAVKQMLTNQEGVVSYEFAGGRQKAVYQTSPLTGWKFAIRFPAE